MLDMYAIYSAGDKFAAPHYPALSSAARIVCHLSYFKTNLNFNIKEI